MRSMLIAKIQRVAVLFVIIAFSGIAAPGMSATDPTQKSTPATSNPPRTDGQNDEPAWKREFLEKYGLRNNELIRRVKPPYPDCRVEYFRERIREAYRRSKLTPDEAALNQDYANHFATFAWKDGWIVDDLQQMVTPIPPNEGVRLVQLLEMTTRTLRSRMESEPALLERRVTGDFVVRVGAPPIQLVERLEAILRKECELPVRLRIREQEMEVYVFSGKYEAKPLTGGKAGQVQIYATELQGENSGGGGGTGSLDRLAPSLEGFIERPVVFERIDGAPKSVQWNFHFRSPFTKEEHDHDHHPELVTANVANQLGLVRQVERRKMQKLIVSTD